MWFINQLIAGDDGLEMIFGRKQGERKFIGRHFCVQSNVWVCFCYLTDAEEKLLVNKVKQSFKRYQTVKVPHVIGVISSISTPTQR